MKKLLAAAALLALSSIAFGATLNPIQLLNPAGSTAGQTILSTGATTAPAWGNVSAIALGVQPANTVVANATASSAAPTAFSMPSCNTSTNSLQWTSGAGFTCYASSATTTGTLAQFAATTSAQLAGVVSDETGSGSLVFGTGAALSGAALSGGGSINGVPIGGTTPSTGAFTTLGASGNAHVTAHNTSVQSVPAGTTTTITGWTAAFDSGSNFSASTGVFTAPATGYYLVTGMLTMNLTGALAVNNQVQVLVIANAAIVGTFATALTSTSSVIATVPFSVLVSLSAGQTVSIQIYQSTTSAQTLNNGSTANTLSIVRIP